MKQAFRSLALFPACFALRCTAPAAPALVLTKTDIFPKAWGTSYEGKISSSVLEATRMVSLFVPKSYDATKRRYPMIFVTDGEYDFEPATLAVRELQLSGHMPESIVVAIHTPDRTQDMTPPGMGTDLADGEERAEKFCQFMARELKPELESKLRGTNPCVFVGHSHGGILAHYIAANWRKEFPFIVSLDAPMHLTQQWLVKNLEKTVPQGGVLRLVSYESRFGWTDVAWDAFRKQAPSNWQLIRRKLPDEIHTTMFFSGTYRGLKEIFSDFSVATTNNMLGVDAMAHYDQLAKDYGATCTPPRSVLRKGLEELAVTGAGPEAHRILQMYCDGYGRPEDYDDLVLQIDEAVEKMKGRPTVKQIVSTPKPTADEMKPFVGTWSGMMGAGSRATPTEVKFYVKDGQGAGTVTSFVSENDKLEQELIYVHTIPGGIEFGFMNGMMPRGLLVYAAHLKDGKLVGDMEMRGIYFRRPDGAPAPPDIRFEFTKKSS